MPLIISRLALLFILSFLPIPPSHALPEEIFLDVAKIGVVCDISDSISDKTKITKACLAEAKKIMQYAFPNRHDFKSFNNITIARKENASRLILAISLSLTKNKLLSQYVFLRKNKYQDFANNEQPTIITSEKNIQQWQDYFNDNLKKYFKNRLIL